MAQERRPKVGVGVLILKEGKILLSQRTNSHAAGYYCGPGGHLEFEETPEECAIRETTEEIGVTIENPRVLALANIMSSPDWHYLQINVLADWKSGEPQHLEPDKNTPWQWFDLTALPEPLVFGIKESIESMNSSKVWLGTLRS